MASIALRNVSGGPLDTSRWLSQSLVAEDEAVDVDGEVVDRLPDAVIVELAGHGQPLALPRSQWTVEGDTGDTVRDVLDRVAGDPARAQAELDAERAGRNRSTLVAGLQRVVDGTAGPSGTVPDAAVGRDGVVRPHGLMGDFSPATATADNPTGAIPPVDDGTHPPGTPPNAAPPAPAPAPTSTPTEG